MRYKVDLQDQIWRVQCLKCVAGEDIARDVAACASEVIMSAKTWMKPEFERDRGPFGLHGNMHRRPWPQELCADGSIVFDDRSRVADVDVVMFCTGAMLLHVARCLHVRSVVL